MRILRINACRVYCCMRIVQLSVGLLVTILFVLHLPIPYGSWIVPIFGLFSRDISRCWSMALAQLFNVFPIFIWRIKITRYISAFIISMALGRGVGSILYFIQRWWGGAGLCDSCNIPAVLRIQAPACEDAV